MSLLANINKVSELFKGIQKYSEYISQFHKYELNVDFHIPDEIQEIKIIIDKIEKLDSKSNYKKAFEIYHLINKVLYKIDNIIDTLELISKNDTKDLVHDIPDTQMEFIFNFYNKLKILYAKYKAEIDLNDIEYFQYIYKEISKDEIMQTIEWLNKTVKQFPFSVNLYAFIMQTMLLNCIPMGSKVCNLIINNIEEIKDFILLESIDVKPNNKIISKTNPPLKTFGLTPSGKAVALAEIFKLDKSIKIADLTSIAKLQKICIVILYRITKKPIEFSIWALIDWNIAKDFVQSETEGINQTTIDRYKTIAFVESKKKKWDFDIEIIGDIDSDHFVIIEKISDNYRQLQIYDREADMFKTGGGAYEKKINRKHLGAFIEYLKNKGNINNCTRISEYHKIQQRKILSNMFLPIKINNIDGTPEIINTAYLRLELYKKLTEALNSVIKKDFKNGAGIKSVKDIGSIFYHKDISDKFNSLIIEQYYKYTKNNKNPSSFPFSELLKSFIADLAVLNRSFTREIHSKYKDIKIDESVFKDNDTKKMFINKQFLICITHAIEKLINDDSNIYQSLIHKNNVLKLDIY